MPDEVKHDCAGSKIIKDVLEKEYLERIEYEKKTLEVVTQWQSNLQKDFCCVTYPYRVNYFNLRKFRFDYNIEESKPKISIVQNRILRIDLPGIKVKDWDDFVGDSIRMKYCSLFNSFSDAKKEVYFNFVFSQNGLYERKICHESLCTHEQLLNALCTELAHYIRGFNNEFKRK